MPPSGKGASPGKKGEDHRLGDLLSEELILLDFRARDKWEAIDRILDHLQKTGKIRPEDRESARKALVARENIASTGLGHGVALPHATVETFERPVAALALSREGVPFQSSDGKPARLVILIVIPRRTQKGYVRTLAGIARLLNYEETREALLAAPSQREALRIVREEEAKEPPKP